MTDREDIQQQRSSFLAILFVALGAVGILFSMFLICGGMTVAILAVVAGLGLFGGLHYLLWGHSLTREVADEQTHEFLAGPPEPDSWLGNGHPPGHRRRF